MGGVSSTCDFKTPSLPKARYEMPTHISQMRIFTLCITTTVKYDSDGYIVTPETRSIHSLMDKVYVDGSKASFYLDTMDLQIYKNEVPFAMSISAKIITDDGSVIGECKKAIQSNSQESTYGETLISRPIANPQGYYMYLLMKEDLLTEQKDPSKISKREGHYELDTSTVIYYILQTFFDELKEYLCTKKGIDLIMYPDTKSKDPSSGSYTKVLVSEAAYDAVVVFLADNIYKYIHPVSLKNSTITVSPPGTPKDFTDTFHRYLDESYTHDRTNKERVLHLTTILSLRGYEIIPKTYAQKPSESDYHWNVVTPISPLQVTHCTSMSRFETLAILQTTKDFITNHRKCGDTKRSTKVVEVVSDPTPQETPKLPETPVLTMLTVQSSLLRQVVNDSETLK